MIQEYREKSFPWGPTVHAAQLTSENAEDLTRWCGGLLVEEIHPFTNEKTPGINVPTLAGKRRASINDYVVKNIGEGYDVVRAETFEMMYELDEPEEAPVQDDYSWQNVRPARKI